MSVVEIPEATERWGVAELSVRARAAGNPFEESIRATFFREGQSVTVHGFYDGEGVFRARFMPDREGRWDVRIEASFLSDTVTGSFVCTPALPGNHGPVRVSPPSRFVYADGSPFVPVGTTCYAWTHQSDEMVRETLRTLEGGFFNKVRMCVLPKDYEFCRNEPAELPFESHGASFDGRRPRPEAFRRFERCVAELGRCGIEADVILFHPYDRWGFASMSDVEDDFYLRYLVRRLSAYRNVWFSLANEWDYMKAKRLPVWERYARIVGEEDAFSHPLSIHNGSTFYDHSRSWITHASVQRIDLYKCCEHVGGWIREWGKPVIVDEAGYEGDIPYGWGNITGPELVRRFWEAYVRGGYASHGETYLHAEDKLWWAKGGELRGTSGPRIRFLREIFERDWSGDYRELDLAWDATSGGVPERYYLQYFGFMRPQYREIALPEADYTIDVIDTWNMTIERLPGTHRGVTRVPMGGRQYMALRAAAAF